MDSDDEDKQLEDKELYKEVPNGSSVLGNTMIKALEKICLRGDLFSDIVNYFFLLMIQNLLGFIFYLKL